MRCMVCSDDINAAIHKTLNHRIPVGYFTQWRIHLEIGVVA